MWLLGATAALTGKVDIWNEGPALHVKGDRDSVAQVVEVFRKWLKSKGVDILDITGAAES